MASGFDSLDSSVREKKHAHIQSSMLNEDNAGAGATDMEVLSKRVNPVVVQRNSSDDAYSTSIKEVFDVQRFDPVLAQKMALVNEAIDEIGMTGFQWKMFFLNGFGYAVDSVSPLIPSFSRRGRLHINTDIAEWHSSWLSASRLRTPQFNRSTDCPVPMCLGFLWPRKSVSLLVQESGVSRPTLSVESLPSTQVYFRAPYSF